jgi:aminoglycoside phosphotransferase
MVKSESDAAFATDREHWLLVVKIGQMLTASRDWPHKETRLSLAAGLKRLHKAPGDLPIA